MTTDYQWRAISLSEYIKLINGYAFASEDFTPVDDGIPLIRIRDLGNTTTEVNFLGNYHKRYVVKNGDILIGMDGDFVVAKWRSHDALLNQRVCKIESKDNEILLDDFLYYQIIEEIDRIHSKTSSTTVRHLSSKDILGISLRVPSKIEQIHIAEILSLVDKAILQTEAIIAKQERIKTGLMQDLLQRGIDKDGNIRSEETHEFKDSPLGRIPVEWEVLILEQVADVIDPNPSHRNPIYVQDGFPFMSTVEFTEPDTLVTNTSRRVAEETVIEQEARCNFQKGSIAFSRKGTIGKTRLLPTDIRFALLDSLCVINAADQINFNYLNFALRSEQVQLQVLHATMGVALPQMSIGRVRQLEIGVPQNYDEQLTIAKLIGCHKDLLIREWEMLRKLHLIKNGLMQDLLSGSRSVAAVLSENDATEGNFE